MNSYIVEPGARADTPPGMLQVGKMTSRFAPRDYPGVAVTALSEQIGLSHLARSLSV